MTKHPVELFKIKLEQDEINSNDNLKVKPVLIEQLQKRRRAHEKKLKLITYQFKVKRAQTMLIRINQAKAIKSLTKKIFESNQKLMHFKELTRPLNNLCSEFKNLIKEKQKKICVDTLSSQVSSFKFDFY